MLRVSILLLAGCTLGGTGRPGEGDDQGPVIDSSACAQAMVHAPLAPAGYDFHDALPTATKNTWDAVSLPQPGDATYPGGRYRTLTADNGGKAHPGCSVDGLSYAPASI